VRTTPAAALCLAVLAACASPAGEDAAPVRAASSSRVASPVASPTASPDPVAACARQVTYWVGESLRAAPDQGFDYQHMGLSGATYEVVRTVTAEARAAGGDMSDTSDTGSPAGTGALVARRALEECRALKGPGSTPTEGAGTGWP
jgi:hypothetical protein